MAFVKVLLQLFVATAAIHLHLNEVDDACSLALLQTQTQALGKRRHTAEFPDLGNIVSGVGDKITDSVSDAVENLTATGKNALGDVINKVQNVSDDVSSDVGDVIGNVISKAGKISGKVDSITAKINSTIAGVANASSASGPLGDIIGAVASAAEAVKNVSSIFGEDVGQSAIYFNMTAAHAAAEEAATIAIDVEKASEHYNEAKASAQLAAKETLADAKLIADKTEAAIEASQLAFQTVGDKVNGRPTNQSMVETTQAAEKAAKAAEEAAKTARIHSTERKEKEKEADAALSATLEAASNLQAKMNETLKDSKVAAGLLKAKLDELMGSTEIPTEAPTKAPTEAPTEAPTDAPTDAPSRPPLRERLPPEVVAKWKDLNDKSGATPRMLVAPAVMSLMLVMPMIAMA